MNSNSAVATGAAGLSAAGIGGILVWLCSLFHVSMPAEVAMTFGAILLSVGHKAVMWIGARSDAPEPAPVAPSPTT